MGLENEQEAETVADLDIRRNFEDTVKKEMKTVAAYDVGEMKGYLENPFVASITDAGITKYMDAVASAAIALAFSGRDMHADDIDRLLDAAGIKLGGDVKLFMKIAHILRLRNHRIYIYAIYFAKALGKEPDLDTVLKVVRVMRIEPDAGMAERTIRFCSEYEKGQHRVDNIAFKGTVTTEWAFSKFKSIIFLFSDSIADFLIKDMANGMSNKKEFDQNNEDIKAYMWAAVSLALSGREIYQDDLEDLIRIVGFKPKQDVFDVFMSMKLRNRLPYVIATYYLDVVGVEPSIDKVIDVAKGMDQIPDAIIAAKALDYYRERKTGT